MSILIKNATIVTQNQNRDILQGDIYVDGETISSVGQIDEKADITINASGKIAIPGLVNSHTHVAMTLLRGLGEGLPLHRWLEEKIWPAEANQQSEDIFVGAQLAFCEMIRSGTTSFADMCIHDPIEIFKAAQKLGIRGTISRGLMDFNHGGWVAKVLDRISSSLNYGNSLVRPSVAAHSPYTCSTELLVKAKELARRHKLKFQIHCSETRKEIFDILNKYGKYPYEYLESIGLMDSDSILAHGGWLTKKEIDIAGKHKATVASCPISNLKLATGGIAQITELSSAGANVSLGTDSVASNNSLNMFETMKMAALLQKHHYWKANILSAQAVFDFATINGARALGINAGSISDGKLADIVLLDRGSNMVPQYDLIANLVYSAGPHNVSDVLIHGNIVMRDRRITTVEESQIIQTSTDLSEAMRSRLTSSP